MKKTKFSYRPSPAPFGSNLYLFFPLSSAKKTFWIIIIIKLLGLSSSGIKRTDSSLGQEFLELMADISSGCSPKHEIEFLQEKKSKFFLAWIKKKINSNGFFILQIPLENWSEPFFSKVILAPPP